MQRFVPHLEPALWCGHLLRHPWLLNPDGTHGAETVSALPTTLGSHRFLLLWWLYCRHLEVSAHRLRMLCGWEWVLSRSDHSAGELIPQGSPQPRRDGSGCTNTPAASLLCGTTWMPPHSLSEVPSGIAPCIGCLPFLSHSPTLPHELSVITQHRIDYLHSYSVSATGGTQTMFFFLL